jgi:hypothetical protein
MLPLLIFYSLAGLGLVALALPLLLGKVGPNPFYGFRLLTTLNNPNIWYAVNTYAAKRLIVAGVCSVATAMSLFFFTNLSVDTYALSCLAVFGVVFGIGLWQSVRYMQMLAKKPRS